MGGVNRNRQGRRGGPNERKRQRQRSIAHQHLISPIAATRNAGSRHSSIVRSEAAILPSGPTRFKRKLPFARQIALVARSQGPIRSLTPLALRFRPVGYRPPARQAIAPEALAACCATQGFAPPAADRGYGACRTKLGSGIMDGGRSVPKA